LSAHEAFEEIFDRVKTPTPPAPNMTDPDTFKFYFEKNNKHLGLYFTKFIMDSFFQLLEDTQFRLGYSKLSNEEWDGKIEIIE